MVLPTNLAQRSKERFIDDWRAGVSRLLNDLEELRALGSEYAALDLGNELVDGDFQGANEGITKAHFVASVSSVEAFQTLLGQGHATNFYRVKQ